MINFKIRFKNFSFWISVIIAFFTPVFAYMGISVDQINSWPQVVKILIDAINNPYIVLLIITSLYNTIIDPTTKGFKDSDSIINSKNPQESKDD